MIFNYLQRPRGQFHLKHWISVNGQFDEKSAVEEESKYVSSWPENETHMRHSLEIYGRWELMSVLEYGACEEVAFFLGIKP